KRHWVGGDSASFSRAGDDDRTGYGVVNEVDGFPSFGFVTHIVDRRVVTTGLDTGQYGIDRNGRELDFYSKMLSERIRKIRVEAHQVALIIQEVCWLFVIPGRHDQLVREGPCLVRRVSCTFVHDRGTGGRCKRDHDECCQCPIVSDM